MTFKPKDIRDGYRADIRAGKNKKRYHNHEGRKKAFYVWLTDKDGDAVSVVRLTTKDVKPDKIKLRGPDDLSQTVEFEEIKKGNKLNYLFLTKTENRILTMRALGKTRSQIARALSGGRSRRSYTASGIKYTLQKTRQKIREHEGRIKMGNISANLEKWIIDEVDRIAEHNGKTRNRVIMESLVEYIDNHEVPNTWETQHFTIDFNRFNRLRKRLMDLENDGFIGVTGRGKDAQLHFK
jgi:transcriptional regulator